MAGEAATIGTFSFFPSKNLGGYGDGGMMVTQDDELATRLTPASRARRREDLLSTTKSATTAGSTRSRPRCFRAKLPHLAAWSAARRENAAYYDAAFADLDDVRTPTIDPANESIFNQYTLRVARRDELQAHLKEKGIGTAIYYPLPLHLQPCFEYLGYKTGRFPGERARGEGSDLAPDLSRSSQQSQLDEVIEAVRGFYGR